MTKQEIIDDADSLTEGKAQKRINFERAYTRRLQKFCQAKPFWWRRRIYSFDAATGETTKDLSTAVRDFEAMLVVELWQNGLRVRQLDPCFDMAQVFNMQEGVSNGQPCTYTIEPGPGFVIRYNVQLDADYKIKFAYWAIPNPNTDNADEAVALVPAIYHHALVSGLKMDFSSFLYGVKSEMYLVSKAEYDEAVTLALARPDFSNSRHAQFISTEDAIQSN